MLELTKSEQQFNVFSKDEEKKKSDTFVQINNEVYLFKYLYSKEQRVTWSEEAKTKYPNKFPIIVEKDHKCQTIDDLQNHKFLMPKAFEMSEVQTIIRRKLKLKKE